jgi:hypothetical protein
MAVPSFQWTLTVSSTARTSQPHRSPETALAERCLTLHATRPASSALRVGYADGLRPPLTQPGIEDLGTCRGTGAVRRARGAEATGEDTRVAALEAIYEARATVDDPSEMRSIVIAARLMDSDHAIHCVGQGR